MKTGLILLRALPFAMSLLVLNGCGTTSGSEKAEDEDPQNPHVSTVPWNKPEKWENKSVTSGGGPGVGY